MTATLYAADGGPAAVSDLFSIDPGTGLDLADVGPLGVALTGLAVDSAGNAFVVTSNNSASNPHSFGSVDLATAVFTPIHDYGSSALNLNDIAFDAGDVLWGIRQDGRLCTIDPATGLTTVIGYTGFSAIVGGGLTFSAAGTLLLAQGSFSRNLYSLNTSTAAPTLIGAMGTGSNVGSLATDPDTNVVYGTTPASGRLWTFDIATGAATLVGSTDIANPDSLAFAAASPPAGPFRIDASPASVTVVQGGSTTTTITSTLLSGAPEPIALTVTSSLPIGATAAFTPTTISDDGGTSALRLATTIATPLGSYGVVVRGDDGSGGVSNKTVTLNVVSSSPAVVNIAS